MTVIELMEMTNGSVPLVQCSTVSLAESEDSRLEGTQKSASQAKLIPEQAKAHVRFRATCSASSFSPSSFEAGLFNQIFSTFNVI